MSKVIRVGLVITLLLVSSYAFASVGYKKDGENEGNATYIDVKNGYSETNGSTVTLYANGYNDDVTTNVSTESNLLAAGLAYGLIKLQIGSSKSISIANGTAGQQITLQVSKSGKIVATVSR
jgi:hypothetical protein